MGGDASAAAPLPKWEGSATAQVRGFTAEAVWPLIQDFYGIHKWLPTIDTSHKVDDVHGLVRYCAAGQGDLKWCHESLLSSDPVAMSLTYQVLDNNMGFKAYQSTITVVPIEEAAAAGCKIVWSFLADPVEGFTREDLFGYLDASLRGMPINMEKALNNFSPLQTTANKEYCIHNYIALN